MNFSNPKPLKAAVPDKGNPLKALFEKVWAGISMISLMVPGTTKGNINSKNTGVVIFILLIVWLSSCGVYLNIQWLMNLEVTGEWFYYCSIPVLILCSMNFLDIDSQVKEFAVEKKILISSKKSVLEFALGKWYSPSKFIFELYAFLWLVTGIIFYDTCLFIALFCVGIIPIVATQFLSKTDHAFKVFIAEAVITLLMVLFIVAQHFIKIN